MSVNSKKLLTTGLFTQILSEHEGKRMSEIMDLILTNFHKKLSLEDAVTTANMTKTAFCKYFKNRTNRTFFDFLTEVRIHHAADTLLRYPDLPIQLIAEQCGFTTYLILTENLGTIKTPLLLLTEIHRVANSCCNFLLSPLTTSS